MTRSNTTAWILIIAGSLLILNYFGLLSMSRANAAILISSFLAIVFIIKASRNKNRKGIFGSTFFSLFCVILISMRLDLVPIDDKLGAGLVIVSLAIANLANFIFSSRKISHLIWAFIYTAIALPLIIAYYKVIPMENIGAFYETYWPAILILIGASVILDSFFRRRRKLSESKNSSFHG